MNKDPFSVAVGNKIKQMRTSLGLSQDDFGYKVNVDRTYICKIENGCNNITLKKLCEICEKCNVTIKDFFSDKSFDDYFYTNNMEENDYV